MIRLEDDRFDLVYINPGRTFTGEDLPEDRVVYHARMKVNDRIHWREIEAPKNTMHTNDSKKFYLDCLEEEFKKLKEGLNESETGVGRFR